MALRFCRSTTREELEQILTLQQKNLAHTLSKELLIREGFVSVQHTYELLDRMNQVFPHCIAKDGTTVIGYALCMHPKFADEIALLKPMFDAIVPTIPPTKSFIVMGQICIDSSYRRKGVFRGLYKKMNERIRPKFDSIITTVDAQNRRSLNAHWAVGFSELKTYRSAGRDWKLLILT